ncbi:hypothetical protein M438DRAFT_334557 [Aureobasidium pullulans EXF-150]|uniref:PA14 domain-containing protein n=1 Tax=Aureobasidium pullulans EXF-150 TaxID=1043002 RepID=A0A074XGS6_AURPU|nr:uncharacterized protein M438DRAFT_334557 [Aureobasidium pullulans EXF-150]KEQ84695.1 hypothetical protein M438DRAFT_334557 [Aureobasidium pullulans EXF-150]
MRRYEIRSTILYNVQVPKLAIGSASCVEQASAKTVARMALAGSPAYTSTVPPSGSVSGTIVVGVTAPGLFTTTVPGTASTPYTVTGSPSTVGGSTPVSVYTPTSAPGTFTTTITSSVRTPYTITGTPTESGGQTPVTVVETPGATAPLPCDAGGYLIQERTLYRLNLTTGVQTLISNSVGPLTGTINSMGYNVLDNYLYAIQNSTTILRIDSTGASTVIAKIAAPVNSNGNVWTSGDIDTNGQFWINSFGTNWAQIDLRPGSATYGQVVASGTSAFRGGPVLGPIDWSYLPGQGNYLFGISKGSNATLVRWSMADHTWTYLQTYGDIDGNGNQFGALYASSGNVLYGTSNNGGAVYSFPIPSGTPSRVTNAAVSGNNDGARCIYAADPIIPATGYVSSTTTLTPGQPGFTSTISPSGTVSGTVIVGTPSAETGYVSSTTTLEPGQPAFTSTIPPSGTVSGTVVIGTPLSSTVYTTVTTVGTASETYTITGTPTSSGDPVPVTIYTPPVVTAYSTTTTPYGGSTLSTSTGTPTEAGGTVPVTVFTPPPSGACYFAPGTCDTGNLRLRYYSNPLNGADSFGAPEGTLGPDYYLGTIPRGSGSIDTLSLAAVYPPQGQDAIQVNGRNYYENYQQNIGGISVDPNNFTLVSTGYFVPQTSGSYQFCDRYADNRDDFYVGSSSAFPCGDSSDASTPRNAAYTIEYWFGTGTGKVTCVNITMVAGFSYPLRNVFGNNGVPFESQFTASGPGLGTNVTDLTGFIAPDSC